MSQEEEIIEMYNFGYTFIQIATLIGIKEDYVKEVIKKWQKSDI